MHFEILRRRKENQREKKKKEKKGEQNLSQKEHHFLIKEGRSCIPKSSHTQITSEGEVRSLTSVYNR